MKNSAILTYEDVKTIGIGNSDEEMVDIQRYDDSIVAQYEKFDMVAYTGLEILVRETVARKLATVNKRLKDKYNLRLKVVYGYRALEVQTSYFNKKQDELRSANRQLAPEKLAALTHNFIAVPEVAGHVTGGAIDVTLISSDETVCDMGTKIADFTDEDRIKTFAAGLTFRQRRFRKILLDEMMTVGFAPFLGEWWHFSYGDREWAAYYQKPNALYQPVIMKKTATVFKIAGGNETAIQVIKGEKNTVESQVGKALLDAYPTAEQAGLLYVDSNKLEMAGGEFCGNASAAAAVLLANESDEVLVQYNASGVEGSVDAKVMPLADDRYLVRTSFNGMSYKVEDSSYRDQQLRVVDMQGIVHVLIESIFPVSNYEALQRKIVEALNLGNREAVGVIWYKREAEHIRIDPVIWVKKVDTLYFESACGSGAIAVALSTGVSKIIQPTGKCISVGIYDETITTECEVAITN